MTDAKRSEYQDVSEVRRRQWRIVEELRQNGDAASKEMAEVMEKILREVEDKPAE